jgi:hypothetical protein
VPASPNISEGQRQAYLQAMGIDCYEPRLQLSGALQSELIAISEFDQSTASASPLNNNHLQTAVDSAVVNNNVVKSTEVTSRIGSAAAAAQALLNDDVKSATVITANKVIELTEPLVAAAQAEMQTVPEFALSIIKGQQILLIDEGLSGDINPADYLQMLRNMLLALGAGKQQLSIDAFVWPMIKNSQIDQSESAARQTLQAFLAKQVAQSNIRHVILMGPTAVQYSSEQTLSAGELQQHPDLSVPVIATLSAGPMLSKPELKRQVWQHLQPLHRALQSE